MNSARTAPVIRAPAEIPASTPMESLLTGTLMTVVDCAGAPTISVVATPLEVTTKTETETDVSIRVSVAVPILVTVEVKFNSGGEMDGRTLLGRGIFVCPEDRNVD